MLAGVGHAAPSQPVPEASQASFGQRVASELEEQMALGLADNGQQTTKEEQVVEPEDPGLLQENEEIEDGAWDVLRKRRLLPGAASSDNDLSRPFCKLGSGECKISDKLPQGTVGWLWRYSELGIATQAPRGRAISGMVRIHVSRRDSYYGCADPTDSGRVSTGARHCSVDH